MPAPAHDDSLSPRRKHNASTNHLAILSPPLQFLLVPRVIA